MLGFTPYKKSLIEFSFTSLNTKTYTHLGVG